MEAVADQDVPPRPWAVVCAAAKLMVQSLFPDGKVAINAVSETAIRELNHRYRNLDCSTDVLSFPAAATAIRGHRGDIALCWQAVERQAIANGNAVDQEAAALIAHGLLHLAGYDHDTAERDAQMSDLTVTLCRRAGIEVSRFGH